MDPGVPAVWPCEEQPRVRLGDRDKAATDAEFAKAAHVTRLTVNNRIVVASMEARAAVADFDAATGRWTLMPRNHRAGGRRRT